MRQQARARREAGFSLLEVMVATFVLAVGVLGMVGVMAVGVQRIASSTESIVAREKAREAVESVHTARDTGRLSWPTIRNVANGGVFVGGQQPLRVPGPDGLVNTADDLTVETRRTPGVDGILMNADDVITPLTNFTREVVIGDVPGNGGGINPNLRQITVNIRYQVKGMWRTYTVRTLVSAFS